MALIDKASLLMVPSTYEAGTLYNVLPSGNRAPDSTDQNSGYDQTRADFTFDRGSNAAATRVNADGLIEKYRENLYTQSNNFSHSDWTPKAGTFTQGVEDPDGGNNAWAWTATNTDPYLYQNKNLSGVHCLSIWVKGSGNTIGHSIEIRLGASINYFTLTSEWQRFEAFGVLSGANNIGFEYGNPSATSGDVIHIFQAQLETGLVATDYLDSGATTAKAGVLIDLPRINYDANGENGALLLEPSRQQLLQYSEYFEASGWGLDGGVQSVTSNYSISPEGVKNAARLQLDKTGTTYSRLYFDAGSLGEATISVYMKSNTSQTQNVGLRYDGTGVNCEVTTEWKRFDLTATSTAVSRFQILLFDSIVGNDETADISIYGAQMEAGSYPTSYIPNHGTSGGVTRAADSCSVTGVSDVIGQTEGTLFLDFIYNGKSNTTADNFNLTLGTWASNIITIGQYNAALYARIYASSVLNFNQDFGVMTIGQRYKCAIAYATNDAVFYVNGVLQGSDTSVVVPAVSSVSLNRGVFENSKEIKQAALFKTRLTNEELATLTTL